MCVCVCLITMSLRACSKFSSLAFPRFAFFFFSSSPIASFALLQGLIYNYVALVGFYRQIFFFFYLTYKHFLISSHVFLFVCVHMYSYFLYVLLYCSARFYITAVFWCPSFEMSLRPKPSLAVFYNIFLSLISFS